MDTTDTDTVNGPDRFVELVRFPTFQAEVLVALLRDAGIRADVEAGGTAGILTPVQFSEGSRVMVPERDESAARVVLAEFDESTERGEVSDADLSALADSSSGFEDPETGAVV